MSFETSTTEATVGLTVTPSGSVDDRLGSLRSVPEGVGITPDGQCLSPPPPAVLADRMTGYAQPLGKPSPGYVSQRYGSGPRAGATKAFQGPDSNFPYKERVLRHYDKTYRTPEKPQASPPPRVSSPRSSSSSAGRVSGSGRDAAVAQPKRPELK